MATQPPLYHPPLSSFCFPLSHNCRRSVQSLKYGCRCRISCPVQCLGFVDLGLVLGFQQMWHMISTNYYSTHFSWCPNHPCLQRTTVSVWSYSFKLVTKDCGGKAMSSRAVLERGGGFKGECVNSEIWDVEGAETLRVWKDALHKSSQIQKREILKKWRGPMRAWDSDDVNFEDPVALTTWDLENAGP